ncbi:hypothetical protein SPONL_18 [uncultured Candidatus Thioglobus sp.]|nr:hypothetical protein SPONL_18 [uncultured Candidatus Thioglobus sp.]
MAAILVRLWFCLTKIFFILIETSPKSIFTGQGFSQRWQMVQWSAISLNSSKWSSETPRRVCSSYKNASEIRLVPIILSRGEYSKLASGTCVVQTSLHLPQRRQDFTISLISPSSLLSKINASCSTKRSDGVKAFFNPLSGINLPLLKCPFGSICCLYLTNSCLNSSDKYWYLVRPIPCSPEITPPSCSAKVIISSTTASAVFSISV